MPVNPVGRAETFFEGRLLIEYNEQVEDDQDGESIPNQPNARKEPGFTNQDSKHAVVHWITRIAIQTTDDELLGGINRCESAFACSEEIPDTFEKYRHARCSNYGRSHKRERQAGYTHLASGLEDAQWYITRHHTRQ